MASSTGSTASPADKRPSDYEYAELSNLVYQSLAPDPWKGHRFGTQIWQVREFTQGRRGFAAAIFVNQPTRQMVVAFRGTNSFQSLLEDIRGVYLNDASSPQKEQAFNLVQRAKELASEESWNLSFTGHSLGGYLAELSLFYLISSRSTEPGKTGLLEHAHAVTFESPGTRSAMKTIQPALSVGRIDLDSLDIITYLSYPNLVNTCDTHVGTVYCLQPEVGSFADIPLVHLRQVHCMAGLLSLFTTGDHRPERHYMLDWPRSKQRAIFYKYVALIDGHYEWTTPFDQLQNNFELSILGQFKADRMLASWQTLPLQHVGFLLQEWLLNFFQEFYRATCGRTDRVASLRDHLKKTCDLSVIDILFRLKLVKNHFSQKSYLEFGTTEEDSTQEIAQIREKLSVWQKSSLETADNLLAALREFLQQPDIAAFALAPGASLLNKGTVVIRGVQAVEVGIPDDTTAEMIAYFQSVSKQFLTDLKQTGTRIQASAFAPGSHVEVSETGKLFVDDVTGVKFTVGHGVSASAPDRTYTLFPQA